MMRPAALQRTPKGAAELGCALTPSGPLPSRALRGKPRAVRYTVATPTAPRWPAPPGQRSGACAQRYETRPERALSPPVLGSRCGVNCPEGQFNITGCCRQCRHSRAGRARCRHRSTSLRALRVAATPVMSCAPQRLQRGQPGTARRARTPKLMRSRLRRHRRHRSQAPQAARSWGWPPPAHHPPPEGAPGLPPLSLPSVAPCSPRQGQALRAREYARP
jgi:hypothetical protein